MVHGVYSDGNPLEYERIEKTEAYAAYREASSAYPHNGLLDLELGWTVWFDVLGKDGQFSLSRVKLVIRALDILAETVPDCEETANQLMHIREMLFSGTLSRLSKENKQAFATQVFSSLSVIYACASTEAITKWYMVIGRSLSEVSLAMCPAFADSARKYFTILPSNAVYYLLYRKAKAEFQEKKYEQAIESCREALSYEGEQESIVHFLIVKSALGLSHSTKDREVKQQAHELARLHAILYQRKPAKSADFIFYFEYGKVFAFFLMRREHFLCREYAVRIAKTKI